MKKNILKKSAGIILAASMAVSSICPIASAEIISSRNYGFDDSDMIKDKTTGGLFWQNPYYYIYGGTSAGSKRLAISDYQTDKVGGYMAKVWNLEYGVFGKANTDRVLSERLNSNEKTPNKGGITSYIDYAPKGAASMAGLNAGESVKLSWSMAVEKMSAYKRAIQGYMTVSDENKKQVNLFTLSSANNITFMGQKVDYTINEDTWYKFDIILTNNTVDGAQEVDYKAYINNQLVGSGKKYDGILKYVSTLRMYGVQQNTSKDLPYTTTTDDDGTTWYSPKVSGSTWWDDIAVASADNEADLLPNPVTVSSENEEYIKLNSGSLDVYAPFGATAADFKNNIVISENGTPLSYSLIKNGEEIEDTALVSGAYIVVTAADGSSLYGKVDSGENMYCEYFDPSENWTDKAVNTMPNGYNRAGDKGDNWQVSYAAGVGDNGENDISMKLSSAGAIKSTDPFVDIYLTTLAPKISTSMPVTFETSFFGGKTNKSYGFNTALLNASGSRVGFCNLNFNANGSVGLSGFNDVKMLKNISWQTDRWYRVAFSYYPAINRLEYYINGEKIGYVNLGANVKYPGYIRAAVNETDKDNPIGVMYIDNVDIYSGGYQSSQDKSVDISVTDESNITICEATSEIYTTSNILSGYDLTDNLNYGAKSLYIYKDGTFKEKVNMDDDLADGQILAVVSEDNVSKAYYTVRKAESGFFATSANAYSTKAEQKVTVSVNTQSLYGASNTVMIAAAEYNEDNTLKSVKLANVNVTGAQNASAKLDFDVTDTSDINVFVWDKSNNKPLTNIIKATVTDKTAE